ncbi:MAG: cyclic nucleotide-binding domain-containing protein [Aquificaceae bacterium]|nr:cyclic nucleotide-binding domain-containing protein [Aquificaceae bacterium]
MISKIKELGEEVKFNMGDVILKEGEKADKVFVLLSGHASVFKKGVGEDEVFVGLAGPGSIFGEMGICLEGKRPATVRASSVVTALVFDAETFLSAVSRVPELAHTMLKELSKRINNLNRRVISIMTSKLMYVLGMYLLENRRVEEASYGEAEQSVTELYIRKFCTEYGLESSKVESIINAFVRAGVVEAEESTLLGEDGKEEVLYKVKFNPDRLKSYLRSIAYV